MDRKVVVKGGVAVVLATAALTSFLHKWEDGGKPIPPGGFVVYADKLARGIPTTCYGMTHWVTSVPPVVGERWSQERCDTEYAAAIERVQLKLLQCFVVGPPQSVFDMASSHAWNEGAANTCSSDAMEAWNRGEWDLGCRRISHAESGQYVWSSVRTGKTLPNGKPEMRFVQGLANRRDDETAECAS